MSLRRKGTYVNGQDVGNVMVSTQD